MQIKLREKVITLNTYILEMKKGLKIGLPDLANKNTA